MTFIIAIIGALNILIISGFGRAKYVFYIVISWWFVWLIVSTFSMGGLNIPNINTYSIYLVMLCCITSGGVFYIIGRPASHKTTKDLYIGVKRIYDNNGVSREKFITKLCYVVLLPINTILLIKAIYFFMTLDTLSLYRLAAFGSDGESSILFNSDLLQFLYYFIISPLSITVFLIGGAYYFIYGKLRLLLLGSTLISMEAITILGRFSFYILILFMLILWSARAVNASRKINLMSGCKHITILAMLLVPLISIGIFRTDQETDYKYIVNTYIVNYHTLGFSMFDDELNNPGSRLNEIHSYGRASLGILERSYIIAGRRFDRDLNSITADNAAYLNEFRLLGEDAEGDGLYFNAFATVLYPLYMDGGVLMVIIGSFYYGYFLAKKALQSFSPLPSIFDVAALLALIYLGLFSLFVPQIDTSYWLFLIYIYILFHINLPLRTFINKSSQQHNHMNRGIFL